MNNRIAENLTQNTQKPCLTHAQASSVDFVDELAKSKMLYRRLIGLGVVMTMTPDGRLAYDAPAGALGDDLIVAMKSNRDDLLAVIELIEERAAIMEYDGGLTRADAERLAVDDVLGSDSV